jgi:hypothetical protein
MSAAEIRDKIGIEIWDQYFKFCVIRNPFDKLLSFFYFNKNQSAVSSKQIQTLSSDREQIESFRNWIKSGVAVNDSDKYLIDGKVCIDYFIRYEDLENGIEHVCRKLNLPFEPLRIPNFKSGFRNHKIPVTDFFDTKTIQLIKKNYAMEIEMFGYDMKIKNRDLFKILTQDLMYRQISFFKNRLPKLFKKFSQSVNKN